MQWLLTGAPIDAATALDWGWSTAWWRPTSSNRLCSSSLRRSHARVRAPVATGERGFYSQLDRAEHDAYEHCRIVMAENALAGDAQKGMSAFLQRRAPTWRGAGHTGRQPPGRGAGGIG
jgi:enoyl-CoA hydratase/carnithine racemase